MLGWYLRQGWPRQLAVLAALAVVVPILWTAIASYLFVDLMGRRPSYPSSEVGSYLVWWDYFLADGQTLRVHTWLAVSGVAAALPFGAYIARQVMDRAGSTKRPSLYGATGFASREQMQQRDIDLNQRPF
jgi:hypothetical protein